MLQTNLKVVAVGEPNIEALTDGEKRTFFESIFSMIVELHNACIIHTQTIYSTVFLTWASQERVGRQINRQPTAPRGFSFAFGKIAWHTPFSRQEPFAA